MRRKSHFENRVARERQSAGAQTVSAASALLNADAVTLLCRWLPSRGSALLPPPLPGHFTKFVPTAGWSQLYPLI